MAIYLPCFFVTLIFLGKHFLLSKALAKKTCYQAQNIHISTKQPKN